MSAYYSDIAFLGPFTQTDTLQGKTQNRLWRNAQIWTRKFTFWIHLRNQDLGHGAQVRCCFYCTSHFYHNVTASGSLETQNNSWLLTKVYKHWKLLNSKQQSWKEFPKCLIWVAVRMIGWHLIEVGIISQFCYCFFQAVLHSKLCFPSLHHLAVSSPNTLWKKSSTSLLITTRKLTKAKKAK